MPTSETLEQCTGYALVPSLEAKNYVESTQINVLEMTASFTWGFSTVLLLAFLSGKVKIANSVIKKM